MKCQKCMQQAVVHLTELLSEGPVKKAVEVHLCYQHAVDAGLLAPATPDPVAPPTVKKKIKPQPAGTEAGVPTAIVPTPPPGGLAVVKRDEIVCPVCGNTWTNFKQTGVMGCPHDYAQFESKLLPLVKRAQEGSLQHAGKVPHKMQQQASREVTSNRLRRQLQIAVDAERYEEAAKLRDALRKMDTEA